MLEIKSLTGFSCMHFLFCSCLVVFFGWVCFGVLVLILFFFFLIVVVSF